MIHTTPDNFVWFDITHRCDDNTFVSLVWSLFDLYAVRSDNSESLLEDMGALQRERVLRMPWPERHYGRNAR